VIQVIAHHMNLGTGHSRRNAYSFKSDFLTRAVAHAPARVKQMSNNASSAWPSHGLHRSHQSHARYETSGTNQSSLKPALTNASMSSISLSASGPSQRMCRFDPWPAASIISPMMLLPFTSSPSFDTQISER